MALTREDRVAAVKKQATPEVEEGQPQASATNEGVASYRIIDGVAKMVVKIKNEVWYFTGSRTP